MFGSQSAEKQKAELTHQKLSHVYHCLATEQVLHKHQLVEPGLLKLVDQPAKLTCKLYEHESIEQRILGMDDGGAPGRAEAVPKPRARSKHSRHPQSSLR